MFRKAMLASTAVLMLSSLSLGDQAATAYQNLLTPLLQSSTDILGRPLAYPSGTPKVTAATVTIPPGGQTGWHLHEVPLFAYILEGTLTVDYGSRGVKIYKAGDSVMEAGEWPHNGMNKGDVPVKLLAVYMGGGDKTNTLTEPAP